MARQQLFELAHNGTLTVKAIRIIKENIQRACKRERFEIQRGTEWPDLRALRCSHWNSGAEPAQCSTERAAGRWQRTAIFGASSQEIDELLSVPKRPARKQRAGGMICSHDPMLSRETPNTHGTTKLHGQSED